LEEDGKLSSFFLTNRKIPGNKNTRSEFTLKPNSICYVTLKPTFRMPAYLACRFNLLIKDVYRGLLVGTGPLVDPGFVGPLSIPVHNFTANPYVFRAGDGFVYFEFTKTSWKNPPDSKIPEWVPKAVDFQPPFPPSKTERKNLDDYIRLATGGGPPQNAIHTQVRRLSKINEDAKSQLGIISFSAIVAGIIFLFTVGALIVGAWQIYAGAQQFTQAAQKDMIESHQKLNSDLKSIQKELEEIKGMKTQSVVAPASPPSTKK
jgi:ABC-type multidrug transport system fused ATPase/permease subunit